MGSRMGRGMEARAAHGAGRVRGGSTVLSMVLSASIASTWHMSKVCGSVPRGLSQSDCGMGRGCLEPLGEVWQMWHALMG